MEHEYVRVEVDNHIAVVTLDRAPVNALSRRSYVEIGETFRSFDADKEIRVAILRSACERAFCAGADLNERFSDPEYGVMLDTGLLPRECFWAIDDSAVPVIAAVDGPALGAGVAIVGVCDVILASDRAVFGLPEINIGLLGGGSHLARMIGQHRMRHAFYTELPAVWARNRHEAGLMRCRVCLQSADGDLEQVEGALL
jgi:enoyl-CoA hydratase